MKALCWNDKHRVSVEEVLDPNIEHPRDAIVRITTTCICGSEVTNLQVGDRVVVPFTISCDECWFCQRGLYSYSHTGYVLRTAHLPKLLFWKKQPKEHYCEHFAGMASTI